MRTVCHSKIRKSPSCLGRRLLDKSLTVSPTNVGSFRIGLRRIRDANTNESVALNQESSSLTASLVIFLVLARVGIHGFPKLLEGTRTNCQALAVFGMAESTIVRVTSTWQRAFSDGRETLIHLHSLIDISVHGFKQIGRQMGWQELLALVLAATLLNITYNLYFHPLARFPGPFWARSSLVSTFSTTVQP